MISQLEWNKLLEFESRDLIERYFRNKHQRKVSARQVAEISANFIQGREYFRNALNAAITVKPLLLYYGVASLTRGLILASSPKSSEAQMKPSHGLDTISWQDALSKGDFAALAVLIRQGTFYELLNTTGNREYFRYNTSAINWYRDYPVPCENYRFTFGELVQTMPDLASEYHIWRETQLHQLFSSGTHTHDDGSKDYIVYPPKKDPDAVAYIFPKELAGVEKIDDAGHLVTVTTKGDYVPHFSQRFGHAIGNRIGDICLTRPINGDIYLSPLAQLYAASFYMGMLSRYFPSIWIGLGRMQKGDAIYPLFTKIIEVIEKFYPAVIVDYLNGPYDFT